MKVTELFTAHPSSVDETYGEHMMAAASFAFWLLIAGFCAIVHAVFPFLFVKTGSRIITRLYDRMVTNRRRKVPSGDAQSDPSSGLWQAFDSAAL